MASKITYWKCVDCNSMINDENMHDIESVSIRHKGAYDGMISRYVEFCYGCMQYHPEVVIAYS